MHSEDLGRLDRVDVRKAFPNEAHNFTPWLADNLSRLSSGLGIELELEGTEVYVGPYRADIVARVPQSDEIVLIENQLEWADLKHLGQVLAYLAGLEARIVVWVATGFRDEHLSAIRWLNEHTVDPFAFFAVKLSVVQIGDSPLAPDFEVLERPNEWDRQVHEVSKSGELSRSGQFRRSFWDYFSVRRPAAPDLQSGYAGSNVWHDVQEVGLRVVQFVAAKRVGVYVTGRWGETQAEVEPQIAPLQKLFSTALAANNFGHNGNHWYVTELKVDAYDRDNWDDMADWLDDQRQKYEEILRLGPNASDLK